MQRINVKLDRMRKPRSCVVMPCDDGTLMVQGENLIAKLDFRTRKGVLNTKGGYFPHLSPMLGAKPFDFPAEFVADALAACPALDSTTELAGATIENTIRVI